MFKKIEEIALAARRSSRVLASASTSKKNKVLLTLAELLRQRTREIVAANEADLKAAKENGVDQSKINRLGFGEAKIAGRIVSLQKIAALSDPVGMIEDTGMMENGVSYGRMRVPLGVIMMIYEARPHVTVNAGAFALKSGNAIILKGGSEAKNCMMLLGELWAEALDSARLPVDAIKPVILSHDEVDHLLTRNDLIDLVIPRGGKSLIKSVSEKSKIPVIKHFEGNCHVYIGAEADREKALAITLDSKLLMPGVCNAAESLLLDRTMEAWTPQLVSALVEKGIEIRGCERTRKLTAEAVEATEEDYYTEYLDKIYSLRIVDGVGEAIAHINKYGSGHTETIVTENYSDARRFQREVDSGVVIANASTMFCDGESLGMGAEIGISTDKIGARGPMGLKELTTYKFVLSGDGQVMG